MEPVKLKPIIRNLKWLKSKAIQCEERRRNTTMATQRSLPSLRLEQHLSVVLSLSKFTCSQEASEAAIESEVTIARLAS